MAGGVNSGSPVFLLQLCGVVVEAFQDAREGEVHVVGSGQGYSLQLISRPTLTILN